MIISPSKIGTILVSRPAGKEAFLLIQPLLRELKNQESIEVDFTGVDVLTPSWADEFVTRLQRDYPGRVILKNTDNPSVKASLDILKEFQEQKK